MADTREENMLYALSTGEEIELPVPITAEEEYLRAMLTEEIETDLPEPYTRKLSYYKALLDRIDQGGFGSGEEVELEVLYGFASVDIPSLVANTSTSTLGNIFTLKSDITIHGLRNYSPSVGFSDFSIGLDGSFVASKNYRLDVADSFYDVMFDEPVTALAGSSLTVYHTTQEIGYYALGSHTKSIDMDLIKGVWRSGSEVEPIPNTTNTKKIALMPIYTLL